jgi:hypothetical protein
VPLVPCLFRQEHASCVTWSFWKPRLRSAPHSTASPANPKATRFFTSARTALHSHTRLTQRPRNPAAVAIYSKTGYRGSQARLIRQPSSSIQLAPVNKAPQTSLAATFHQLASRKPREASHLQHNITNMTLSEEFKSRNFSTRPFPRRCRIAADMSCSQVSTGNGELSPHHQISPPLAPTCAVRVSLRAVRRHRTRFRNAECASSSCPSLCGL